MHGAPGGKVANHGLSPTALHDAEGGKDAAMHSQAPETTMVWMPSKSVSQGHGGQWPLAR